MFRAIVAFACCLPLVASAQEAAVRPEDIKIGTGGAGSPPLHPSELRAYRQRTPRLDHRFVLALEDVVRFATPAPPPTVTNAFDGRQWTIAVGETSRLTLSDNADFEELTKLLARAAGRTNTGSWKDSSLLALPAVWDELDAVNGAWIAGNPTPEAEKRAAHALVSLATLTADPLEIGDRLYGRAWAMLALAGGESAATSRDGLILAEVLGYTRFARTHASNLPSNIAAADNRRDLVAAVHDATMGTLADPELARLRHRAGVTEEEAARLATLGVFGLAERLFDRLEPRDEVPFDSDTEVAAIRTRLAENVRARLAADKLARVQYSPGERVVSSLGQPSGVLGDVRGYLAGPFPRLVARSTTPAPLTSFDGRWPAVGATLRSENLFYPADLSTAGAERAFVEVSRKLDERPVHRAIARRIARLYEHTTAAIEASVRAYLDVCVDEDAAIEWASMSGDWDALMREVADAAAAITPRLAAARQLIGRDRLSADDASRALERHPSVATLERADLLALESFEVENGHLANAIRLLRGWLAAHPRATEGETTELRQRLARALRHVGRAEEALAELRSAAGRDDPLLRGEEVLAIAASGHPAEAYDLSQNVIALAPEKLGFLRAELALIRRAPDLAGQAIAKDHNSERWWRTRGADEFLAAYRDRPSDEARDALRSMARWLSYRDAQSMAVDLAVRGRDDLAATLATTGVPLSAAEMANTHAFLRRTEGAASADAWVVQHWNSRIDPVQAVEEVVKHSNPAVAFVIPVPADEEKALRFWYLRAVALAYLREHSGPRYDAVKDFFRARDTKELRAMWGRVLMGLAPVSTVLPLEYDGYTLPDFLHFLGVLAEMHDDLATANEWYADATLLDDDRSRNTPLATMRCIQIIFSNRSLARLQAEGVPQR